MFLLRQRGLLLSAFIAATFLFRGAVARGSTNTDDNNLREDVIECEQAAAHLRDCCPNATSAPDCHYYNSTTTEDCGCSGSYVSSSSWDRPIDIGESKSIQSSSCEDLAANGTCDRQWQSNAGQQQNGQGCSEESY